MIDDLLSLPTFSNFISLLNAIFILLNSLYRFVEDKVTRISEIKNMLFIILKANVLWLMMMSLFINFSDHSYSPAVIVFHLMDNLDPEGKPVENHQVR